MTPQQHIEVILARQLAEHLDLPVFIVDPIGNLLFYNEPAGVILGTDFDESGPMEVTKWSSIFQPVDDEGVSLDSSELPLVKTLQNQYPAHSQFSILGMDDTLRKIEVTAFPLVGQTKQFLGAVAIFWEVLE